MYVWAGNARDVLVNEYGQVKDANYVSIEPKQDLDGYSYVEIGKRRFYVHELVIQNHGKPPNQNRLPKEDETVRFMDGNKKNVAIKNLQYDIRSGADGSFRGDPIPKDMEDYVWELLKQGKTYNAIVRIVSESIWSGRTLSTWRIAQIKKERSLRLSKTPFAPTKKRH